MNSILKSIDEVIGRGDFTKALTLIETHKISLFSSPDIKPVMVLLKRIPEEAYQTSLQKLIKGWIAFLCGENLIVSQLFAELHEEKLGTAVESSLFYGLKALASFMRNPSDGLRYAQLSADVLEDESESFYLANAKLTFGQLLGSIGENRKAAHAFFTAYHLFKKEKCAFPQVVSLVNYGLKKHALGEVTDILETFRTELQASSSPDEENRFFEILKLPLGIAYFELNLQELAISHLESAKEVLYAMAFVHMFGVLEMHLTLAYAAAGTFHKAHALLDGLEERIGKLHDQKILTLCSSLRIQLSLLEGKRPPESDVERLAVEFLLAGTKAPAHVLLALARLRLAGFYDKFDAGLVIHCHKELEAAGNVPGCLTTAILAAEYHYRANDKAACRDYLKKAVTYCRQHRLTARFLVEKAECLRLIAETDRDLAALLHLEPDIKAQNSLMTDRELEILALVAEGLSNEEIARKLYIGLGTIKWHMNNIFSKLSVKRRSQAILEARRLGLL